MVGIEMALIRIEMGISDDQMSQTASVGKQGIQGVCHTCRIRGGYDCHQMSPTVWVPRRGGGWIGGMMANM